MSWWVIGDGSFPRASVGDNVDVIIELVTGTDSRLNQSVTAIARPAYGSGPQQLPDGSFRWWHLLYGDGWNAGWWSGSPRTGRVSLDGFFIADIRSDGDGPITMSGRISALHSVEVQLDPLTGGGWREVGGTETLIAVREVPPDIEPWHASADEGSRRAVTSVLVDLDLGNPPIEPVPFQAGAVDTCGDMVWVLHQSDPTLLRIDTRTSPPEVVEFVLPMTIESPCGEGTRRVHATPDGCWIVGEHDIHCVRDAGQRAVDVERACIEGGLPSFLHQGNLYISGSTRDYLAIDRRHGMIRRPGIVKPTQVYDTATRTLQAVTDTSTVKAVSRNHKRPDMAPAPDGAQWAVGRGAIVRTLDGEHQRIDVSDAVEGTVTWTRPNPEDDPATAALIAEITVDPSTFLREES